MIIDWSRYQSIFETKTHQQRRHTAISPSLGNQQEQQRGGSGNMESAATRLRRVWGILFLVGCGFVLLGSVVLHASIGQEFDDVDPLHLLRLPISSSSSSSRSLPHPQPPRDRLVTNDTTNKRERFAQLLGQRKKKKSVPIITEDNEASSLDYRNIRAEHEAQFPPDDVARMRTFVTESLRQNTYTPIIVSEGMPYDIYHCPDTPPDGYPIDWNIRDVVENWNPDDTEPRNRKIYQ
eukprot:scaffold28709_cov43-Attheya_sp.AAC.4